MLRPLRALGALLLLLCCAADARADEPPPTTVHARFATADPPGEAPRIEARMRNGWWTVCAALCDAELRRGQWYRVTGGGPPTEFRVARDGSTDKTYEVTRGDNTLRHVGIATTVLGGAGVIGSLAVGVAAAMRGLRFGVCDGLTGETLSNCQAQQRAQTGDTSVAFEVAISASAAVLGTGIALIALGARPARVREIRETRAAPKRLPERLPLYAGPQAPAPARGLGAPLLTLRF